MIDVILKNIYPIIGAILLACFVGYIGFRNNRRNRTVEAAKVFRTAINIDRLSNTKGRKLEAALLGTVAANGQTFEGEFFKHKRAVKEFRVYLGIISRFRLDRAWKKYHGGNEEHPDLFVKYCLPEGGPEF